MHKIKQKWNLILSILNFSNIWNICCCFGEHMDFVCWVLSWKDNMERHAADEQIW